jgi:DNA repair exonuclease SbcCD nuclease subunit
VEGLPFEFQAARGERPDAILIPGDLVDDYSPRSLEQVSQLRQYFPDEPILVTTGNHDLYSGDGHFDQLCSNFSFRPLRQGIEHLGPGPEFRVEPFSRSD